MKIDTPIFDDYDDYDDGQCNDTYDTSIPKSPPHCVPVLIGKGSSHWIDCDGDPYDSDFQRDFEDFY